MAISDLVVGGLMAIFGLVGLFLAAGALDDAIYIFGLSLFGYACCFLIGQVRRHYDMRDIAGNADHG
jgi:hypothetical protein